MDAVLSMLATMIGLTDKILYDSDMRRLSQIP